jgi:hypothetical protein
MNLILSYSELERSRNDEKIVRETAQQVIKDFALFGITIEFPPDIHWAYYQLFDQLNEHVHRLLGTNNKLLLSLLYQIDVSEKRIQKSAMDNAEKQLSEIVTDLILERELKKVLTRNYFKQNS